MNFASPLKASAKKEASAAHPLRIAIVGHVDHGKSTLIGRLFHDTGSLPDGKLEAVTKACEARGVDFAWAFLVDALKAERDQNVTIDTAQMWFHTSLRNYVIIDAPGHVEFVQNMVTGAAAADAALLVVDADEGMREQTRRHGYLLRVIGVRQVAVAVNKMDRVSYSEERFRQVAGECTAYLREINPDLADITIIPISATEGDNIAAPSANMPWYTGPTITDTIDGFSPPTRRDNLPLRMPVQCVYKFDHRRILAGWLQSGRINVGDTVVFSPSNKQARVASIEVWPGTTPVRSARAGQSIGITLDKPLFIERGEVISHQADAPLLANTFDAKVFWFGHEPVVPGKRYTMRLNSSEFVVTVEAIEQVVNIEDLTSAPADQVRRNEVADVTLRCKGMASLDDFSTEMPSGRFVLIDRYDIVGGGLVSTKRCEDARSADAVKSLNITRVAHRVPLQRRWHANGHKSGILWLTGLSGAGKSTLAFMLEQHLHNRGFQVYTLDGDNVRHGLCADLGFSPEDRAENIRRVGEMALGYAEAGLLVITAFISPYRSDRSRVRQIAGNLYHEIYVKADVATCEGRDPKGLYRKARSGEITEFTGISAPYEDPANPELTIDTTTQSEEQSLAALLDYVERQFGPRTLAESETDLKIANRA